MFTHYRRYYCTPVYKVYIVNIINNFVLIVPFKKNARHILAIIGKVNVDAVAILNFIPLYLTCMYVYM